MRRGRQPQGCTPLRRGSFKETPRRLRRGLVREASGRGPPALPTSPSRRGLTDDTGARSPHVSEGTTMDKRLPKKACLHEPALAPR